MGREDKLKTATGSEAPKIDGAKGVVRAPWQTPELTDVEVVDVTRNTIVPLEPDKFEGSN